MYKHAVSVNTLTPANTLPPTNEELLELYLSLSSAQREEKFSDTRKAAELIGLSVRTIQFWIETGAIRAITIGRKYKVDLDSVRDHLKRQVNSYQF